MHPTSPAYNRKQGCDRVRCETMLVDITDNHHQVATLSKVKSLCTKSGETDSGMATRNGVQETRWIEETSDAGRVRLSFP